MFLVFYTKWRCVFNHPGFKWLNNLVNKLYNNRFENCYSEHHSLQCWGDVQWGCWELQSRYIHKTSMFRCCSCNLCCLKTSAPFSPLCPAVVPEISVESVVFSWVMTFIPQMPKARVKWCSVKAAVKLNIRSTTILQCFWKPIVLVLTQQVHYLYCWIVPYYCCYVDLPVVF